jgi:hypothetical protein
MCGRITARFAAILPLDLIFQAPKGAIQPAWSGDVEFCRVFLGAAHPETPYRSQLSRIDVNKIIWMI